MILDFFCAAARLCVEIDGAYHQQELQRVADERRDEALAEFGVRTLRFAAWEVERALPSVLARIRIALSRR